HMIDRNVNEAVAIVSDIIQKPTFPEDEFYKEKENRIQNLKARDENITNAAFDRLYQHLYDQHPYAIISAGTPETINRITLDDIKEYYHRVTRPDTVIISLVGNIKFKQAVDLLSRHFGAWKTPADPSSVLMPAEVTVPEQDEVVEFPMDFKQSFIAIGRIAPPITDDPYVAVKVLDHIIGGGMSRRLFQKFREEKQYAYSTGSFYPSRIEPSHLVLYIGLDKKNISDARREFDSICSDLIENPVSAEELTSAQEHLAGQFIMSHQSTERQAWYLGWYELIGKGYEYDRQYVADIYSITPADIQKAAQNYLQKPSTTIIIKGMQ
ncbi:MAG: hypothetical protein GF384_05810, partial [Elusimicrobia bacterium]|nr:hypothetical protein [Elusimicrobiota bacterium]MBD3412274.1 hypothetical protein [Elusimicrobiota bacterium]